MLVVRSRRHAFFLTALLLGAVVRAVVMVAYRPVMLFPDGLGYLAHADPFTLLPARPSGYSLFLRPFVLATNTLTPIPATQHLMGLGLAVICYAFLLRRGLPPWGATLAVLPVLFDPLQLVLEHYVLSDVLFEVLLVLACLALLWRRRPALSGVVVCGLLVGSSVLVRGAGTFLLVVFLVAVVCLRVRWQHVVAFALAALLPIGAYMVDFHQAHGQYAVTTYGPRFLYARLAPLVDCHDPELHLPSYERILCPRQPIGERPDSNWYMWGHKLRIDKPGPDWRYWGRPVNLPPGSPIPWRRVWGGPATPQRLVDPPPGMRQVEVLKDFDKRVVRSQPMAFAKATAADLARGFSPFRTTEVPGYPASYWLFADHYWSVDTFIAQHGMNPAIRKRTSYDPTAAAFMAGYGRWIYAPGPLMAALLLAAAAAALGLRRSRWCGDRVAVGLLAGACLLTLLTGAAVSGFSWRYQLPQIPLLPMAGALGVAALVRGRSAAAPATPATPLRLTDRAAVRLVRLPTARRVQVALQRAADRGLLQLLVAGLAGLAAGGLVVAGGVASGWARSSTAVLAGAVVAVGVVLGLVRASRAQPPEMGEPAEQPSETAEPAPQPSRTG